MKLIIAGGRGYSLTQADFRRLDRTFTIDQVITGAATGADTGGEKWAIANNIDVRKMYPEWSVYGKAAGPKRNKAMAKIADAVVLFPGGKGTESMYQEALQLNLDIYDWRENK